MASPLAGLGLLLALMLAGIAPASADRMPPSAVNTAGEQRMLPQRVAKSYSQVGLNVMPAIAVTQISAAINQFESNQARLKTITAASAAATRELDSLAREWSNLRQLAGAAVSREAALQLSRQADRVLDAAERLTRIVEDEGRSAFDPLVNLAGRQRMLSQRIAKAYLLRSWGIESSSLREEIEMSINDFAGGLAKLKARADNTEAVRSELEEIAQQWEWLQAALSVEGADSYRLIVAEAADSILEAADRVTRLLDQQSRH